MSYVLTSLSVLHNLNCSFQLNNAVLICIHHETFFCRGHSKVLEKVRSGVKKVPGLFVGGNFISGVSVGDCINYGAVMSNNISAFLLDSRFGQLS
jgi:protoporphyrinogen oxidase